jgi:hypothetical protein
MQVHVYICLNTLRKKGRLFYVHTSQLHTYVVSNTLSGNHTKTILAIAMRFQLHQLSEIILRRNSIQLQVCRKSRNPRSKKEVLSMYVEHRNLQSKSRIKPLESVNIWSKSAQGISTPKLHINTHCGMENCRKNIQYLI